MKKKICLGVIGLLLTYMFVNVYSGPSEDSYGKLIGSVVTLRLGATVLLAVILGFLFIAYILPTITNKFVDMVFSDSGQAAEPDVFIMARNLASQGLYQEAIEEYHQALQKEPYNRSAWEDVAQLQLKNNNQPELAIVTYQRALTYEEWEDDDIAFFLFRISEWYINPLENRESGVAILKEIREKLPETRHSANATNELRKLGVETDDVSQMAIPEMPIAQ